MNDFEQLFAQLPIASKQNFIDALRIFLEFKKEFIQCNK